jgi:hypothetical protein
MLNEAGAVIENRPEVLFKAAFATLLTLTTQVADGVFGTVHGYDPPVAAVEAIILTQVVPLFVEYSNFTFVTLALVQVILVRSPDNRFVPVKGVKILKDTGARSVTIMG